MTTTKKLAKPKKRKRQVVFVMFRMSLAQHANVKRAVRLTAEKVGVPVSMNTFILMAAVERAGKILNPELPFDAGDAAEVPKRFTAAVPTRRRVFEQQEQNA